MPKYGIRMFMTTSKSAIDMKKLLTLSLVGAAALVASSSSMFAQRDTCRIVANFRSSSDASDWAVLYVTLMGGNYVTTSQPVFVKGPNGTTQMRLFASRKPPLTVPGCS